VAANSQTETFAAMRLEINSSRWQGVPFYIRAGKNLPVTCTDVLVRLRRSPTVYSSLATTSNHIRFRISPEVMLAFGMSVMAPGDEMVAKPVEIVGSRAARSEEKDAYERVLGDALAGDATLFARQDYVEEAWRIVDPYLKSETPVYDYGPQSWGPDELEQKILPAGGWHNPTVAG
jgi:glucose-6-phosphate 1-dehydrogenase